MDYLSAGECISDFWSGKARRGKHQRRTSVRLNAPRGWARRAKGHGRSNPTLRRKIPA